MSKPILYTTDISPPCRAVLLTAKAIGLQLEQRETSLVERDQLKENFKKMNPQHTIPTLDDDGVIIWDSHAIICYLVGKYGKNDSLYPKDLAKRALIDQRLHFDGGILFALLRGMAFPIFTGKRKTICEERLELVKNGYEFMDKFLEGHKWLAGDSYTLADISCIPTICSLQFFLPIDGYPNLIRWRQTCENELPGYAEINAPGDEILHATFSKLMQ